MNILEEFWYGNIEPAEYDTSSGKEYKGLLQLISRNEEKLLATMTEEQKDLFSRYTDCVREHQAMAECLLFQNSFRLGGRMMLEVMRGGTGNLPGADVFGRNHAGYQSDSGCRYGICDFQLCFTH